MSGPLSISGVGRIYKKLSKTTPGGQRLTQLNIRASTYKPGRNGGEPVIINCWVEATAWGANNPTEFDRSDYWDRTFKEQDVVFFSGIPEPRTYMKGNEPACAIVIAEPKITHLPPSGGRDEQPQAVGVGGSQEIDDVPF